jgi:hypothetical protein
MCPAKHIFSKNKWSKVKVYAYVSKFVYFSYFWIIIGGSKCAIVIANTLDASGDPMLRYDNYWYLLT